MLGMRMTKEEKKAAHDYNRGWDYAAGQLLRLGEVAVERLEMCTLASAAFGDYNSFDRGIDAAIVKWKEGRAAG